MPQPLDLDQPARFQGLQIFSQSTPFHRDGVHGLPRTSAGARKEGGMVPEVAGLVCVSEVFFTHQMVKPLHQTSKYVARYRAHSFTHNEFTKLPCSSRLYVGF